MLVQEYLSSHTLDDLTKEFAIKVKKYDDRISLNYDQIESYPHRFNPIVRECRGLVLSYPDFKVLSRSFDRFFNYGEDPKTGDFNLSNSVAYEKVDGSLMPVYFDGKNWNTHTRQMAFGEGQASDFKTTFAELFQEAIQTDLNSAFDHHDPNFSYIFEMVSPMTRVVKQYGFTRVYLLGIRDKITGKEYHNQADLHYIMKGFKYPYAYPQQFYFNDFADIVSNMKELPAMDEGYVCCQELGSSLWRLKVKNPSYMAIAHLRGEGGLSIKRIITLVLNRDEEEYLGIFPEDRPYFQPYIDAYHKIIEESDILYNAVKNIENQKEFALKVKDHPLGSIMFMMRKDKQDFNISNYLEKLTEQAKVRLFEQVRKM